MIPTTRNNTVVIVYTHHIHEIPPEVERVVFLKEGQLIRDDTKDTLLNNDSLSQLFDTPIQIEQRNGFYQAFPSTRNQTQ